MAVVERQALDLFGAVADARDLAQTDGRAVFARHDDVGEVLRLFDAREHLHHAFALFVFERAHRQVLVVVAHRAGDLFRAHPQGFHGRGVEVDVDGAARAADQRDRAHAAHVLQTLLEGLFGPGGQLHRAGRGFAGGQLGGVGQDRDRPDGAAGGVEAQDAWLIDFVAKRGAQQGDFFAHVFGGFAAIDVQLEFNDDDRGAFVAARGQGVDAGDGVDRFFHFFGDFGLDDFGRGAWVVGVDHHHGEVDAGELVHLQALERKHAQHHKGQHDHGRKDRVAQ